MDLRWALVTRELRGIAAYGCNSANFEEEFRNGVRSISQRGT